MVDDVTHGWNEEENLSCIQFGTEIVDDVETGRLSRLIPARRIMIRECKFYTLDNSEPFSEDPYKVLRLELNERPFNIVDGTVDNFQRVSAEDPV